MERKLSKLVYCTVYVWREFQQSMKGQLMVGIALLILWILALCLVFEEHLTPLILV